MVMLAEQGAKSTQQSLLRLSEVLERCGQSKSSLYRAISLGQFPKAVQTPSGPRWKVSDLVRWESRLK